jgi:hypothetical protein
LEHGDDAETRSDDSQNNIKGDEAVTPAHEEGRHHGQDRSGTGAGLSDARLAAISGTLKERFAIGHCTIQLEHGDEAHPCAQESVD